MTDLRISTGSRLRTSNGLRGLTSTSKAVASFVPHCTTALHIEGGVPETTGTTARLTHPVYFGVAGVGVAGGATGVGAAGVGAAVAGAGTGAAAGRGTAGALAGSGTGGDAGTSVGTGVVAVGAAGAGGGGGTAPGAGAAGAAGGVAIAGAGGGAMVEPMLLPAAFSLMLGRPGTVVGATGLISTLGAGGGSTSLVGNEAAIQPRRFWLMV